MTAPARYLLAVVLGTALLLLLLLMAALNDMFPPSSAKLVQLRPVQMYVPPPLPPPPVRVQKNSEGGAGPGSPLTLSNNNRQPSLELMKLAVTIPAGMAGNFGKGLNGLGSGIGSGPGMGEIKETFSLPELDSYPVVLSSPLFAFPQDMARRNIGKFRVMFHIVIDETGATHPIGILENPYPVLEKQLMDFVKGVRFSPPRKSGAPVKAEYSWPVMFENH